MTRSNDPGVTRRVRRIFPKAGRTSVIIPLDDGLITGPGQSLRKLGPTAVAVLKFADATLGFPGLYLNFPQEVESIGQILNLTSSTTRGGLTRKVQTSSVADAIRLGVDAVAVHVNICSSSEGEMLRVLGSTAEECSRWGIPLVALMYPRTEKDGKEVTFEDLKERVPRSYGELVSHAARIGVELGADVVQVPYTGDSDSFKMVVESASGVPVIMSTGRKVNSGEWLGMAKGAMLAGAAGVSSGRNVLDRPDPAAAAAALSEVVHDLRSPDDVIKKFHLGDR